ncbi:MAG TPA: sulfatase [Tepidisphaeraceae bacterium]|nr:sulfatase [Tepidisphaeraceae bacterium]
MSIRITILLAVVFAFLAAKAAQAAERPNFIVIITDDQRFDALGCMGHPFLKTPNIDKLRAEGALFSNAFVTTSLCAPSRASFATGTYAHRHLVTYNERGGRDPNFNVTPNVGQVLQKAGYQTAWIGKWHQQFNNDGPRPGFSYWLSFKGQGVYNDPQLNENGRSFKETGYITEILNKHAVDFIKQNKDKPFCMFLAHKAVHDPRTVRERDRNLYPDATIPEPESWNDTLEGKPEWQKAPSRSKVQSYDPANKNRIDYFRLLTAVDDGVGEIVQTLKDQGQLDNTMILYTSDNGYFMGEHKRGDKRLAYEESIRIPWVMRYTPMIKPGSTVDRMVLNIDVAPTICDLAGVKPAETMQGMSLVPLMQGKTDGWRKSFLYEYWVDFIPSIPEMIGVRTDDMILVKYPHIHDIDEMYDLKNDPKEMHNVAQDPKYAEKKKELEAELERLKRETDWKQVASTRPTTQG